MEKQGLGPRLGKRTLRAAGGGRIRAGPGVGCSGHGVQWAWGAVGVGRSGRQGAVGGRAQWAAGHGAGPGWRPVLGGAGWCGCD